MATAAVLIAALRSLDPDLPVGALRVERVGGEMTSFHLNDVVEVHVMHHADTGAPVAAWVVTATRRRKCRRCCVVRSRQRGR